MSVLRRWTKGRERTSPDPSARADRQELAPLETIRSHLDQMEIRPDIKRWLCQGRAASLLRRSAVRAKKLEPSEQAMAALCIRSQMVPIRGGRLMVPGRDWRLAAGESLAHHPLTPCDVKSFWIDRFAVANRDYIEFVRDGGYRDPTYWDAEIRDARLEFVDQTGVPGPRYWHGGSFPPEIADHPVVGICWYEASAYAAWAGKRLPTDPEWLMAASSSTGLTEHGASACYPWGELFDPELANIWETGIGQTVPVYRFAAGDAVTGVRQLVGNVWEWTASWFAEFDVGADFAAPSLWRSLRGGAFDTYFANQASKYFQSGDSPLARRRNVGFRCVVDADSLELPMEEAV